jgi:peptidoglycan hydrolase-like protein with peptidoglycan-binding domain
VTTRRSFAGRLGIVTVAAAAATVGLAGTASASPGVSDISYGSSNHHGVWCVQAAINNWHGSNVLTEDGDFGANTLTWVKKFQKGYGLSQDGIVGKHTGNDIWIFDNRSSYCYTYVPTST